MAVKALSVQQPWAHLITIGAKDIENRSRRTTYRGPIAIHASLRADRDARVPTEQGRAALRTAGDLAFGAIIAVAQLTDSHQCPGKRTCSPWAVPGMWHWRLSEIRALPEPIACTGALGLWTIPPGVQAALADQLGDAEAEAPGDGPDDGAGDGPADPLRSVYAERAALIAYLAGQHPAVIVENDLSAPDMALIYLDTPAGQLSWHLHPHDLHLFDHVARVTAPAGPVWDGHSTDEKYRRLRRLVNGSAGSARHDRPSSPGGP
ncbi:hypothetical protein GCM10010156_66150 [Planobispora rosea]|uniref:WDGH domain-containing protein n=1 Tax=Planobispora rosea TaxID=35762 RepID=A0A8J3WFC0_PLARO|nr:hypothetical protein [Planobispora rosea]GGS98800.1 hypothetical protein GCM10010156_66150 [Planobispora rosea]GIH87979.1 hypothetical protein Pro02_63870 [Planobispora rosea]